MSDQTPGTASTANNLSGVTPGGVRYSVTSEYIAALEKITREQGAAWLAAYAKSFDAPRGAAPYPIPADDDELAIEFFGRGLPSRD